MFPPRSRALPRIVATARERAPGSPPGSPSHGFTVRVIALYRAWEEPLAPSRQASTSTATDDHLGRKISHKSQRELRDLGLVVDDKGQVTQASGGASPA